MSSFSSRLSTLLQAKQRIEPDTETLHDSESVNSTESEEEQYTFIDSWKQGRKKTGKEELIKRQSVVLDDRQDSINLPDLALVSVKEYLLFATTSNEVDPAEHFNRLVRELAQVFELRKNLIDEINVDFFGNNYCAETRQL